MQFWAKHFRKRCYFSVQDHQKSAGRFYRLDIILTDFSKYNRRSGDFCPVFLSDFLQTAALSTLRNWKKSFLIFFLYVWKKLFFSGIPITKNWNRLFFLLRIRNLSEGNYQPDLSAPLYATVPFFQGKVGFPHAP